MKKVISTVLAVVMLLTTVITVNAASFSDVKSSDWFYSSVNYVADKGIMQGTSNTKFAPKASLTRAMGVTLLYRVAGTPSVPGVNIPFTDVKGGQWYTDAVKWAYKNGIVTGKTKTSFATNDNITRAEFATILNRYSDFMKYTLPSTRTDFVTDVAAIPSWAFAAVTVMYKAEIINGKTGGVFDPNANITRAEAAAMIERFMKAPKDGSSNGGNANPETQPPVETPDIPTTDKLVIKEKKYDYNGANVMILNVENQSNKNLNLTISAKYLDASGKTLYAENRMIEGFPANYRNYVVFEPGLKFDKFTYEVKTSSYSGPAYMQYLTTGSIVKMAPTPSFLDYMKENPRTELEVDFSIKTSYQSELYYIADFVLFDKYGEIYWIENSHYSHIIDENVNHGYKTRGLTCDIPYKDFVMPDVLKGTCTGLIGIRAIYDEAPNF